jgi:hypothetical protein
MFIVYLRKADLLQLIQSKYEIKIQMDFKLIALSMQFSFAQEKTVSGVVSDSSGPLPGVNVVVKGLKKGSQQVRILSKCKQCNIRVQFIGFYNSIKSVVLSTINVVLVADAQSLSEVVITSWNKKRDKKSLGYSTPKINATELTAAKLQT